MNQAMVIVNAKYCVKPTFKGSQLLHAITKCFVHCRYKILGKRTWSHISLRVIWGKGPIGGQVLCAGCFLNTDDQKKHEEYFTLLEKIASGHAKVW